MAATVRMANLVGWIGKLVDRARGLGDPAVISNRLRFVQEVLSEGGWDRDNLYSLVGAVRKGDIPLPTAAGVLRNCRFDQQGFGSIGDVSFPPKTGISRREKSRLKLRGIQEEFAQRFFAGSLVARLPRGQFQDISTKLPKEYQPFLIPSFLSLDGMLCEEDEVKGELFALGATDSAILSQRIGRMLKPHGWKIQWRENGIEIAQEERGRSFEGDFSWFRGSETGETIKMGVLQVLFQSDLLTAYVFRNPAPFLRGALRVEPWPSDFSLDDNGDEAPKRMLEFRTSSPQVVVTTHIDLDRVIRILGELPQPSEIRLAGDEWRCLFAESTWIALHLFVRDSQNVPADELRQALNTTAFWQIEYGAELFLDSLNPRWIRDHPLIVE